MTGAVRRGPGRYVVPMLVLVACLCLADCRTGATAADGNAGTGPSKARLTFTAPGERRPAPQTIGLTPAGQRVDLAALRGRITVVNFWASWCPPCRAETPALVRTAHQRPTVAFLGVSKEDADTAATFVHDFAVPYPTIVDRYGTLAARWPGVPGLPTTYVLDPHGGIAARFIAGVTTDDLDGVLDRLSAET
ncbi:TlpA disulfide reductase family protein [Frankia sp. R82]|uniref:TlpA family protein disulfide reductase n=1 Tax=Frankia sp. R82 TaxID=2950553 RepID=UPI002042F64A|nr:TlpA disulfide reductase family protein [Frankia sp. R82]MCM3884865.1 TlpA family protein disulfide reductase [Frankia sp. R82]